MQCTDALTTAADEVWKTKHCPRNIKLNLIHNFEAINSLIEFYRNGKPKSSQEDGSVRKIVKVSTNFNLIVYSYRVADIQSQ